MAYCKNCGFKIGSDAYYCPKCGTKASIVHDTPENQPKEQSTDSSKTVFFKKQNYTLENLPPGFVIEGRYEIVEKIGRGGSGAVYRAHDKTMAMDKALKIIPEAIIDDAYSMDILRNEARNMVALNHPNIVRFYNFHPTGEIKFIDMEFIDGQTLAELKFSAPERKLPETDVRNYAAQFATGMAYAHQQKVLHRDIKPQNIMIVPNESGALVKIMDFGIAETLRSTLTRLGQKVSFAGTPVYMSPEQMLGESIGKEADIYSFGATLYDLLTGNPPFYQGNVEYQIRTKEPGEIPYISAEMNQVLQKCLAKRPEDRFPDFEAVNDALQGKSDLGEAKDFEDTLIIQRPQTKSPAFSNIAGALEKQWEAIVSSASAAYKKLLPYAQKNKKLLAGAGGVLGLIFLITLIWRGSVSDKSTAPENPKPVTIEEPQAVVPQDPIWLQLSEIDRARVGQMLAQADSFFSLLMLVPPGDNAFELYQEVLKLHPTNAHAHDKLASIKLDFINRTERELAAQNFDGAITLAGNGLSFFADDSVLLSQIESAKELKNSNSAAKAFQLAEGFENDGKLEQAIRHYTRAGNLDAAYRQRANKKIAANHEKSADRLREQGDDKGALERYDLALEFDLSNEDIKDKKREIEEAAATIAQVGTKLKEAATHRQARRFAEAIASLDSAKSLNPEIVPDKQRIDVYLAWGDQEQRAGKNNTAIEKYSEAADIDPGDRDTQVKLRIATQLHKLELDLIYIEGGTFEMGDTFGDGNEKETPAHKVTVSDFWMSKFEITFEQYEIFCKATSNAIPDDYGFGRGTNPVIGISWEGANAYCKWASEQIGVKIRLPYEAEWEYAARAGGKRQKFPNGNTLSYEHANFRGTGGKDRWQNTSPVGSFTPNALGLYDMAGNVMEWCYDRFDERYYQSIKGPQQDPTGPAKGEMRVFRGGAFNMSQFYSRTTYRAGNNPKLRFNIIGFRVVRIVE